MTTLCIENELDISVTRNPCITCDALSYCSKCTRCTRCTSLPGHNLNNYSSGNVGCHGTRYCIEGSFLIRVEYYDGYNGCSETKYIVSSLFDPKCKSCYGSCLYPIYKTEDMLSYLRSLKKSMTGYTHIIEEASMFPVLKSHADLFSNILKKYLEVSFTKEDNLMVRNASTKLKFEKAWKQVYGVIKNPDEVQTFYNHLVNSVRGLHSLKQLDELSLNIVKDSSQIKMNTEGP